MIVMERRSTRRRAGRRSSATSRATAPQRRLPHDPAQQGGPRREGDAGGAVGREASVEDVGYINAHGTSTPYNDASRRARSTRCLDGGAPPVSSTKSAIGHLLGAAGAVEAIAYSARCSAGCPPTLNFQDVDPDCDLDYIPDGPREAPGLTVAMSNCSASAARTPASCSGRRRDGPRRGGPATPARRRRPRRQRAVGRSSTSRRSRRARGSTCCSTSARFTRRAASPATASSRRREASTAARSTSGRRTSSTRAGSLGQAGGATIVRTIEAAEQGRRAGRRLPALRRRAPAGGHRRARRLRVDLPRDVARDGAADQRHLRPVRGRRGVLAVARHARDDGRRGGADVPHRAARHREGHARGRHGRRARRPPRAPQDGRLAHRGRRRRLGLAR